MSVWLEEEGTSSRSVKWLRRRSKGVSLPRKWSCSDLNTASDEKLPQDVLGVYGFNVLGVYGFER